MSRSLKLQYFLFVIIACLFNSCKKENDTILIEVVTLSATDITGSSALLNGEVNKLQNTIVDEIGFYIDTTDEMTNAKLIQIDVIEPSNQFYKEGGNFEALVEDLNPVSTHYFQAYAIDNTDNLVKGEVLSITVSDFSITDYSPKKSMAGEQIILHGTNFGTNIKSMTVLFGDAIGDIVSIQENRIVVTVPEPILPGSKFQTVTIVRGVEELSYNSKFEYSQWSKIGDHSFILTDGYSYNGVHYAGTNYRDIWTEDFSVYKYNMESSTWEKYSKFPFSKELYKFYGFENNFFTFSGGSHIESVVKFNFDSKEWTQYPSPDIDTTLWTGFHGNQEKWRLDDLGSQLFFTDETIYFVYPRYRQAYPPTKEMWKLNSSQNEWIQIQNCSILGIIFELKNEIFVFNSDSMFRYNIEQDIWLLNQPEELPKVDFGLAGVFDYENLEIDNKNYFLNTDDQELWAYNYDDKDWSLIEEVPFWMNDPVMLDMGYKIYIGYGNNTKDYWAVSSESWYYYLFDD